MKITNTQKEIIKLIEPFMDKILTEGCLFYYKSDKDKEIIKYDWEPYTKGFLLNIKIIWHYDITAVLKYINAIKTLREINWETKEKWEVSKYNIKFSKDFNYIEIWEDRRLFDKIPNKPLHLYTEEENKKLLSLLFNH